MRNNSPLFSTEAGVDVDIITVEVVEAREVEAEEGVEVGDVAVEGVKDEEEVVVVEVEGVATTGDERNDMPPSV